MDLLIPLQEIIKNVAGNFHYLSLNLYIKGEMLQYLYILNCNHIPELIMCYVLRIERFFLFSFIFVKGLEIVIYLFSYCASTSKGHTATLQIFSPL